LPVELIGSIIAKVAYTTPEYGEDDGLDFYALKRRCVVSETEKQARRNLKACSLVSQVWRAATVPYLFAVLQLPIRMDNTTQVLEYLIGMLDTVPTVCQNVRNLRIVMLPGSPDTYPWEICSLPLLCRFIRKFPGLKDFAAQDLVVKADEGLEEPSSDLALSLHLDRFSLVQDSLRMSSADILYLLWLLGHVSRVSIFAGYSGYVGTPLSSVHTLEHLRKDLRIDALDISYSYVFLELAQALFSPPIALPNCIKKLSLVNLHGGGSNLISERDIQDFIITAAPFLEEFHCDLDYFVATSRSTLLDLSLFRSLRALRMRFVLESEHLVTFVRRLRSLIPDSGSVNQKPPPVRSITILLKVPHSFSMRTIGHRFPVELATIDGLLTKLSTLREFRIANSNPKTLFLKPETAALRSALPFADGLGVLRL